MIERPELLSPAGSFEAMKAAFAAGADAVYMGGRAFGARAFAENPDDRNLIEAIDYAHLHGRRLYLTVNTLLKENELRRELRSFMDPLYAAGVDAVLVQDLGVLEAFREWYPDLELHASTQMAVSDGNFGRLLRDLGVKRLVLPRELSLAEIAEIKEETGLDIEAFVHGALCYSYSGRCLMSSFIGGRSGNRGRCAQPCRLPYTYNGSRGTFLSMRDLDGLSYIPQMLKAGVGSFKIEGRMKKPEYVALTASIYRRYLDMALEDPGYYRVDKADREKLESIFLRRGYTDGYFSRHNGAEMISPREKTMADPEGSESLLREINEAILADLDIREKVPASAAVKVSTGEKAVLSLSACGKAVSVSGGTVRRAEKAPLSAADVSKQITKSGGTPFRIEKTGLTLSEDAFMSIGELNSLRREALAALQESILSQYRRELPEHAAEEADIPAGKEEAFKPFLTCSVISEEQLDAALSFEEVKRIYIEAFAPREQLPGMAEKVRSAGKELYIALPEVPRMEQLARLEKESKLIKSAAPDGFLHGGPGTLEYAKNHFPEARNIANYGIYCMNSLAVGAVLKLFDGYTIPAELRREEILRLTEREKAEIMVYGRMPLMISAQCPLKTSGKCRRTPGFTYLLDRTGRNMPVRSICSECVSVIYNAEPLYIPEAAQEAGSARIVFTDEDFAAARKALNDISGLIKSGKAPGNLSAGFTRGHYRRGIQ
ncbi:MAG: U32 family peptidase [Lachnospiraceae bacterium]|nr:U32 family peptidase [Lachnospiraceae bacterium]